MNDAAPLGLFAGFGIELEYIVADAKSLDVRPIVDQVLARAGGEGELEVCLGEVAISNELALHVLEFKTAGPAPQLAGLGERFQSYLGRVQPWLDEFGARLLPTGMHPWMIPDRDFKLFNSGDPEDQKIYQTFDRLFGCQGHGWSNLQSMHINLPFANDDEFGRLHAAIRVLLPLLPGLAASSPLCEGRYSGMLDTRLQVYWHNARPVPSISGEVIPEAVFSRHAYETEILQRIYRDMAELDPEGILRHEWVNARGCIARFERMALEIRVLDTQECPAADLAIAAAVVAVLRALVEQRFSSTAMQQALGVHELAAVLRQCLTSAEEAVVEHPQLLAALGFAGHGPLTVRALWEQLIERTLAGEREYAEFEPALQVILGQGCLARRIARAAGAQPSHARLQDVYRKLGDCLLRGELFRSL